MTEKFFDLQPLFRWNYADDLLKNLAVADNGHDIATVDESSRVMLNCQSATFLKTSDDLRGGDIFVTDMRFCEHSQQVLFCAQRKTYLANFQQRTIQELLTSSDLPGTCMLPLEGDDYATISSSRTEPKGGIEIAIWSLAKLQVKRIVTSEMARYVRCAAYFPDSRIIVMGCTGGAVLTCKIDSGEMKQVAQGEASIDAIVACHDSGKVIVGQFHGLISEVSIAEGTLKDLTEVSGMLVNMSRHDEDRLLVITTLDAIGIDLKHGVFAFWNTFRVPRAERARFSNNLQYVALERHRDLEVYRVADLFNSLTF